MLEKDVAGQDNHPLLTAKIYPPGLPADCIWRERLLTGLIDSVSRKKTIVTCTAPVGYGKTTLAAEIANNSTVYSAWYSLGPLDNDPEVFARYFLNAMGAVSGERNNNALQECMKKAERRDLELVSQILSLINDCQGSRQKGKLLVLDELQHLQDPFLQEIVKEIIEYLPETVSVVLVSREDTFIPLSAYRLEGNIREFRIDDLRAGPEQIERLFSNNGVPLSSAETALIEKKTEGWWACLRFFMMLLKTSLENEREKIFDRFGGTDRFISEFLMEEMFSVFSPVKVHFVTRTSIPEQYSPELAKYLSGIEEAGEIMTRLVHLGFLTPMGNKKDRWYRYHPLLRDYAKHCMDRTLRSELHGKTAEWFQRAGLPKMAGHHLRCSERLLPAEGFKENEGHLPPDTLSRREREILTELETGAANEEIAGRLFISPGTVKWHLTRIYEKLGVKNRAEALVALRRRR